MQQSLNEKLSLLVDEELDSLQAADVLKTLNQNQELQAKYSRYALIGQAMKHEQCSVADSAFAGRVREALSQEPVYLLPRQHKTNKSKTVGFAVAASLFLAIVGLTVFKQSKDVRLSENGQALVQRAKPMEQTEQMNARFKEYLQAHDNVWYVSNNVGTQPYARLAGYHQ